VRADAKRNYDKIVEVAREVFREKGYDASLDEIAKRAGVGPGTLYRHFPQRENLIDAVLQSWVDRVNDMAEKALAREGSDRDVLLGWFDEYVALISQHRGGPAKITTAMDDPTSPIRPKCQVLAGANERVLDQLRDRGALRPGVESVQVCRLVGGIATVADQSGLERSAVRPMLEVVADGLLQS
jgi:AcrR family transcriptional regulator